MSLEDRINQYAENARRYLISKYATSNLSAAAGKATWLGYDDQGNGLVKQNGQVKTVKVIGNASLPLNSKVIIDRTGSIEIKKRKPEQPVPVSQPRKLSQPAGPRTIARPLIIIDDADAVEPTPVEPVFTEVAYKRLLPVYVKIYGDPGGFIVYTGESGEIASIPITHTPTFDDDTGFWQSGWEDAVNTYIATLSSGGCDDTVEIDAISETVFVDSRFGCGAFIVDNFVYCVALVGAQKIMNWDYIYTNRAEIPDCVVISTADINNNRTRFSYKVDAVVYKVNILTGTVETSTATIYEKYPTSIDYALGAWSSLGVHKTFTENKNFSTFASLLSEASGLDVSIFETSFTRDVSYTKTDKRSLNSGFTTWRNTFVPSDPDEDTDLLNSISDSSPQTVWAVLRDLTPSVFNEFGVEIERGLRIPTWVGYDTDASLRIMTAGPGTSEADRQRVLEISSVAGVGLDLHDQFWDNSYCGYSFNINDAFDYSEVFVVDGLSAADQAFAAPTSSFYTPSVMLHPGVSGSPSGTDVDNVMYGNPSGFYSFSNDISFMDFTQSWTFDNFPSYPYRQQKVFYFITDEDYSYPAPLYGAASVAADGLSIVMEFDINLSTTTADASSFTVGVNGSPVSISGASALGQQLTLTLNSAIESGKSVTLSYEKPSACDSENAIKSTDDIRAASIATTSIINNSTFTP